MKAIANRLTQVARMAALAIAIGLASSACADTLRVIGNEVTLGSATQQSGGYRWTNSDNITITFTVPTGCATGDTLLFSKLQMVSAGDDGSGYTGAYGRRLSIVVDGVTYTSGKVILTSSTSIGTLTGQDVLTYNFPNVPVKAGSSYTLTLLDRPDGKTGVRYKVTDTQSSASKGSIIYVTSANDRYKPIAIATVTPVLTSSPTIGSTLLFANTATAGTVSTDANTECNLDLTIPYSATLPNGTVVKVKKVNLASWNDNYVAFDTTNRKSDPYFININNIRSLNLLGTSATGNSATISLQEAVIQANSSESLNRLSFEFGSDCLLTVGVKYPANTGNALDTGVALLHNNGNLCYASGDAAAIRYVSASAPSILSTATVTGSYPVYEMYVEVVSIPQNIYVRDGDTARISEMNESAAGSPLIVWVESGATVVIDEAPGANLKFYGDFSISGVAVQSNGVNIDLTGSDLTTLTINCGEQRPQSLLNPDNIPVAILIGEASGDNGSISLSATGDSNLYSIRKSDGRYVKGTYLDGTIIYPVLNTTPQTITLTADTTLSSLNLGDIGSSSSALTISNDGDYSLTLDLASGIYDIATGSITFTGSGTTTLIIDNGVTFTAGTTFQNSGTGSVIVRVNEGGICEINGKQGFLTTPSKFILNGGSLVNNGADIDDGKQQITNLELTADSLVGGTSSFGMIGIIDSRYTATTLTLNGHTLTVNNTGGNKLFMVDSVTTDDGIIRIKQGVFACYYHNTSTKQNEFNCTIQLDNDYYNTHSDAYNGKYSPYIYCEFFMAGDGSQPQVKNIFGTNGRGGNITGASDTRVLNVYGTLSLPYAATITPNVHLLDGATVKSLTSAGADCPTHGLAVDEEATIYVDVSSITLTQSTPIFRWTSATKPDGNFVFKDENLQTTYELVKRTDGLFIKQYVARSYKDGKYVAYGDLTTAINNADEGTEVELFEDSLETGNVEITKSATINIGAHDVVIDTLTLSGEDVAFGVTGTGSFTVNEVVVDGTATATGFNLGSATVTVSSGSLVIDPGANYTLGTDTQLDATYTATDGTVKFIKPAASVTINDTTSYYPTLSSAISAFGTSEGTLTLFANTESGITLSLGQTLVAGSFTTGGVAIAGTVANGYELGNNNGTYTLVDNRTSTWTGDGDNNSWSTAANWSTGFAPTQYTTVTFPEDGAPWTADIVSGDKCAAMVLNGNTTIAYTGGSYAAFSIYGGVTGTGTLTLSSCGFSNQSGSVVTIAVPVESTATSNCYLPGNGFTFNNTVTVLAGMLKSEFAPVTFNGKVTICDSAKVQSRGGTGPVTFNGGIEVPASASARLEIYDGALTVASNVALASGASLTVPASATTTSATFEAKDSNSYVKSEISDANTVYSVETYKTVTFKNDDGTTLQTIGNLRLNDTVAYSGDTPTKAATAQYTYTFTGWTPEVVAVTGDATYTAQFSATVNSYAVTFINEGVTVQSGDVEYGATPAYTGATPAKESTAEYSYTFAGWATEQGGAALAELPAVAAGGATYYAVYTATVNNYVVSVPAVANATIESVKVNGSAAEAVTGGYSVPYGATVVVTYAPAAGYHLASGALEVTYTNVTGAGELSGQPLPSTAVTVAKIGDNCYASLAAAVAAAQSGDTVTLLADVALTERLFVNAGATPAYAGSGNRYATTSENKAITLDLNGFNITTASNIALAGGSLAITGEGTIETTNSGLAPVEVRGTGSLASKRTLTFGSGVTLAGGAYGLNVFGSNDNQKNVIDVTVNGTVEGTLFVLGNLKNAENEINIVVNGTVTVGPADPTASPNIGIALNGNANVTVNDGAVVSGESGIEVRAGSLTVNGGTITATASAYSYKANGSGSTTRGAAISVAQHTTVLPTAVTLNGGTLQGVEKVYVKDVNGDMSDVTVQASAGYIASAKIPEGYKWVETATAGMFELVEKTYVAQIGTTKYESLAEAIAVGGTVTLLNDVALTERLFVNAGATPAYAGSGNRYATTSENKAITLDLNGFDITTTSNIALAGGSLTITGEGTIATTAAGLAPVEVRGTGDLASKRMLTIGENVTLAGGAYGLNVFGSNDAQKNVIDVTVNGTVNGTLFVLGNLKNAENEINIVVNGKVAAPASTGSSPNVGIALNGNAAVTVNAGAQVSGDSGIEVRAGSLTVNGGTITATASEYSYTANGSGSTTWGAAISVAQHTTVLPTAVTLNGGTLVGPEKVYVKEVNAGMPDVTVQATAAYTQTAEIPEGYKWVETATEGVYELKACDYVAQIGDTKYETLAEAVSAAVSDATVTLLKDCEGAGIFLGSGAKTITIDFGGFTYTVVTPVGSSGTVNQMLHFEAGNTVTLMNGRIEVTDDAEALAAFEMVMQNYCNLTIEGMEIDGTGIAVATYSDPKYQAYPGWYNTAKPQFNYNGSGTSVISNSTITVVGDFGIDDTAKVTIEGDALINANKIATKGTDERYASATPTITVEVGAKFSADCSAILTNDLMLLRSGNLWVVEKNEVKGIDVFETEDATGDAVATITVDPASEAVQEFLAASEDGKTLEEALSTESENGLMGWQNYVLGQNPSEDLSVSAAPKSETEASLGKTFTPPAVTDTGFTVTYTIETQKSGTEEEPTKVENGAASIDLSTLGDGNNAQYDMKMTVVMTKGSVAVTQTVEKAVGVMKVASKAKFTIVAVPWKSLGSGDIKVNELLHTGNRSAGDKLYAYDKDNKDYASGTWELKADMTWEPVGVLKNNTVKYADENMTITRGQGVWLERVNANEPIYLLGQVPETTEESVDVALEAGTADNPGWNLVASPAAEDLDVTNLSTEGAENDQIIVPTEGAPVNYTVKDNTWGYWKPKKDEYGIVRKVWTTDNIKVPAGQGFWYLNGGSAKELGL